MRDRTILFLGILLLILSVTGCDPSALSSSEQPEARPALSFCTEDGGWPPESAVPFPSYQKSDEGQQPEELRGVWISYFNMPSKNLTEEEYRAQITSMMQKIKDFGLNTVFFQVRPYSDALYPSSLYPFSHLLTGEQGSNPGYDPLAIVTQCAHDAGLRLHAWLNPYRIQLTSSSVTVPASLADGYCSAWEEKGMVLTTPSGKYLNPASDQVNELIVGGVKEILEHYAVDGIHFDDYFYPGDIGTADEADYQSYTDGGGTLSLDDWRRENVSTMVKKVHEAVAGHQKVFGIAPEANIDRASSQHYADLTRWASEKGFVDYLCPQIYFGFQNQLLPFSATLDRWDSLSYADNVALYVGLAVYKTGEEDKYAGVNGKSEWQENSDLLARQLSECRQAAHCRGVILYEYDALFSSEPSDVRKTEISLLQKLLNEQT
ncbi:MAG: family 10 glycosylhydrolase [Clostridiales bacterium]|nr:family 10 glycosylhydrolase [Clostridiales bacterium]